LKKRVFTALGLIPIVLGVLFFTNPWPVLTLAVVALVIGAQEIGTMLSGRATLPLLGLAALALVGFRAHDGFTDLDLRFLVFFGTVLTTVGSLVAGILKPVKTESYWNAQRRGEIPALWLAGPLVCLIALHQHDVGIQHYRADSPVLMALIPVWIGDTAAILVGKTVGRHALAPNVSPGKTVEGSLANFGGCLLAAWLLGIWLEIPLDASLLCGSAAGLLGQAGDLFESAIKRKSGFKDSGVLLPGHGGLLDRLDSILFAAPAVALILTVWLP
jgi:phosphatidate cytidylyltransferase